MTSFYSEEELRELGLKSYGKNVMISRKASIYSAQNISIGDNVRIDDFCILSGSITIGSNIHIGAYSALFGKNGIVMEDYSYISTRVTIFSAVDDLSGDYLVGPNQKEGTTNVTGGPVILKQHAVVASNSTVFANLTINEGAVIGAHSMVKKDIEEWTINVGCPAKCIKHRKKGLLKFV